MSKQLFLSRIDPKAFYAVYFHSETIACYFFGPMIVGKFKPSRPSDLKDENALVKFELLEDLPPINEQLHGAYREILQNHGVHWKNIDIDRTLGVS